MADGGGAPRTWPTGPRTTRWWTSCATGGAIEDATHLYWYLRPSDRWPTLEFRAMDVAIDIDTAVAVAGLARALVRTEIAAAEPGQAALDATPEMVGAALWRAARYGLRRAARLTDRRRAPTGGGGRRRVAGRRGRRARRGRRPGGGDDPGDRDPRPGQRRIDASASAVRRTVVLDAVVAMARGSLTVAD